MKPEELRALTREQLDQRIFDTSLKVAEKGLQLRALLDAGRRELLRDPRVIDAARCRAWSGAGTDCYLRGDKLLGAPAGWPQGVDGDELVSGYVREITAHLETAEPTPTQPDQANTNVARLRALINGERK